MNLHPTFYPPPASLTKRGRIALGWNPVIVWQPLLGAERVLNIFLLVSPNISIAKKAEVGIPSLQMRRLRSRERDYSKT